MKNEPQLMIDRVLNFPISMVFDAWTNPDYLLKWYAPKGCTIRYSQIDIRTGGKFHSCIDNPEFGPCWVVGTYLEVQRPTRLVFTMSLANEAGEMLDAISAGHDAEWQPRSTVILTLKEIDRNKTQLILHQDVSERVAKKTGAYPSWLQMLDNLEALLAHEVIHA